MDELFKGMLGFYCYHGIVEFRVILIYVRNAEVFDFGTLYIVM